MKECIKGIFQEPSGKYSATRVCLVFATFVTMSTWSVICIKKWAFFDLPLTITGLISLFIGNKVISKKLENGKK